MAAVAYYTSSDHAPGPGEATRLAACALPCTGGGAAWGQPINVMEARPGCSLRGLASTCCISCYISQEARQHAMAGQGSRVWYTHTALHQGHERVWLVCMRPCSIGCSFEDVTRGPSRPHAHRGRGGRRGSRRVRCPAAGRRVCPGGSLCPSQREAGPAALLPGSWPRPGGP